MNHEKISIKSDDKFKNIRFSVNFYTPITKKNATYNQLLLKVLASGCMKYPTLIHINRSLAMLYGSKMNTYVKRVENNLSMSVVFDFLSEKYSDKKLLGNIFAFAKNILTEPLVSGNAFDKEIFEREKNILKTEIEALINNKRRYANIRCLEIVCGDDEYGINTQGYIDVLNDITNEELYNYYKYIISSCHIKIFAVGNIEEKPFLREANDLLSFFGDGKIEKTKFLKPPSFRLVDESADITQGKLAMAFVAEDINMEDEYTGMVFDGLFGGTVVSKLFNNVREKMSLCYYASSAFIKQKGIILVQSGIDFKNFEKARDAITAQLEEIKSGAFTEEELSNAVSALVSSVLSARDENAQLLDFYENRGLECEILSPEEVADRIKAAAVKSKIVEFAKKLRLSAVFFLKGENAHE